MKQLISTIGDRLQALFPPNRVMLVLAGPITAASLWLSAWVTANVPGVELPGGMIAGAMGLVGLIVVTLIYKWFDQWQKGETVGQDIEAMLDQLTESEEAGALISAALGTFDDVGQALTDLRGKINEGTINEAEIDREVTAIAEMVALFLHVE